MSREDLFWSDVCGIGDVGPSTTDLSSHKVEFGRDSHDGSFQPCLCHGKVLNVE